MSNHFQRFTRGECPICQGARRDCRQNTSSGIIHCRETEANPSDYLFIGTDAIGFGMWADRIESEARDEDRRREWREQRERERQIDRERHARSLTPIERDREIRSILDQLTLTESDRAILGKRAYLSPARIEDYRSIEPWQALAIPVSPRLAGTNYRGDRLNNPTAGILIPVPDENGRYVALKLYNPSPKEGDGKYTYLSSRKREITPNLPNGEIPIAVYWPQELQRTDRIGITEGVEFKPAITADRLGIPVIGASGGHFASSPESLTTAIESIRSKLGNPNASIVLYPDAGSLANPSVTVQYQKLAGLFPNAKGAPEAFEIADWGHGLDKRSGDIDEIGTDRLASIELLSPDEFFALAPEREPLPFWERLKRIAAAARKEKRKTPTPKPLPTPDKRLYNRADRLDVWINAGRFVLDLSPTGDGKSYDAGTLTPEMLGVDQIVYVTNDPRNVSTPTLTEWPVLSGRHDGLNINDLGETRRRKPGDSYLIDANCYRPRTMATLTDKNIDRAIDKSVICRGCLQFEKCANGIGQYNYLGTRRDVLAGDRMVAHPSTLPDPSEFDYSRTALIWEESELSFYPRKTVTVVIDDIKDTITALIGDEGLFSSLRPLLNRLKEIFEAKQPNRYGWDGKKLKTELSSLVPDDLDIEAVKRLLAPNLDFLNPTAEYGESIENLPPSARKRFSNKDSTLSETASKTVLKQWLPEFIDSLRGTGYLSLNRGELTLSFPDDRPRAIARAGAKNIFLSATEHPEYLKHRLGVESIDTVTTGDGLPDNLDFFQVTDLGRMGKNRGNGQKQRSKAILDHYQASDPENTAFIRFQSHAKEDGDRESLHHFVHSQGTNAIAGKPRLIIDGLPCPNIESLKHDYACFTGNFPDDEDFKSYTHHRILSLLRQEIGRVRANLHPDQRFEIVFLTDYDLSDLIPSERVRSVKAHEIAPDAETPIERTKRLIREAVDQLKAEGKEIGQRAIARVTGLHRETIRRLRAFIDELLGVATNAIDTPYSKCGHPPDRPEPPPDDAIFLARDYLPLAIDGELLGEFEAILSVFPRRYWLGIWEAIPAVTQERLLSRLLAIE